MFPNLLERQDEVSEKTIPFDLAMAVHVLEFVGPTCIREDLPKHWREPNFLTSVMNNLFYGFLKLG